MTRVIIAVLDSGHNYRIVLDYLSINICHVGKDHRSGEKKYQYEMICKSLRYNVKFGRL